MGGGDIEDASAFRGEMLTLAHGLAGSVVHLLDVLGTDVYREVRVPGNVGEDDLEAIATSIGVGTAIQSQYGAYAAYRQLYEDCEDKRRSASAPKIDAASPTGSLIGGLIVRGPSLHRLRPHLERSLSNPVEPHEDAPEFAVEVPLQEVGREAFAAVVSRMLQGKGLRPTREAVDVLRAQTASPYAVAWGLHHLADDNGGRDIRPDEVRYALAALEPVDLLSDLPPTLGKVLTALLRTDRRLSQTDLAEVAGVSTESIRTYREALEALGLLNVNDDGYRLVLSFRTDEDRRQDGWVLPAPVSDGVSFVEAVSDVAEALLTPEEYADPGGIVYEALLWPAEPWALVEDAWLEPWVGLAARLVGANPLTEDRIIRMGPEIEQTSLPARQSSPA